MTSPVVRHARLNGEMRAAARKGDVPALERALDLGAEICKPAVNNDCRTALLEAAFGSQPSAVAFILSRIPPDRLQEQADFRDRRNMTALGWAARRGCEPAVRMLLAFGHTENELEWSGRLGQSPFLAACEAGSEECARLAKTVSPQWQSDNPARAISLAVNAGARAEWIRELLSGATDEHRATVGTQGLFTALKRRDAALVALLLPVSNPRANNPNGHALKLLARGWNDTESVTPEVECARLLMNEPDGRKPPRQNVTEAFELATRLGNSWALADFLAPFSNPAAAAAALAEHGAEKLPAYSASLERVVLNEALAAEDAKRNGRKSPPHSPATGPNAASASPSAPDESDRPPRAKLRL